MAGPFDFLRNNNQGLMQLGLGLLSGRTGQEQAALGAQGLSGAINQNKTVQWLQKTNPDLAAAVQQGAISPGDAWKMAYTQKLEAAKPKNNFITAGKNLYNVETGAWVAPPAGLADDEEWGLNPVWGEVDGKTVIGQVSKTGKFKPLDTGGFTPTPVLQNIDTGTAVLSRNSRTGQVVAETPKDLVGAEAQKAVGEAAGQAQAALPGARGLVSDVNRQIKSLKEDPYLPSMLGPWDSRTPDLTSDAARVAGKMKQLSGGAFLQARGLLKGGGAITDFESQKAEEAFARLNRAQSVEDYNAALDEFNLMVQQGLSKLEAQAAMGGGSAPAGAGNAAVNTTGSGVQWKVKR